MSELIISPGVLEALINGNSAAIGGFLSTTVTYPIDVIKTKMQSSDGSKYNDVFGCIKYHMEQEGLSMFARGWPVKCLWSMSGKWVFYGAYSAFSSLYASVMKRPMTFRDSVIIGYLSELCTVPPSLPFEAIATVMQTDKTATSMFSVAAKIWNQNGVSGFLGSAKAFWILGFQAALTTTFFEQLKAVALSKTGKSVLSTLESFLIGALARCLSTCIMFPVIRIKTLLQAQAGGKPLFKDEEGKEVQKTEDGKSKKLSIPQIIVALLARGPLSFYSGLTPELTRGVISSAVTLAAKERVAIYNRALLVSLFTKSK